MSDTTAPATTGSTSTAGDASPFVVEVDNLTIHNHYAETNAVSGVSFTLRPGEVIGIVGESGRGKTITCRALLGALPELFEIVDGDVRLFGRDVRTLSKRDWVRLRGTGVAAVFQDPASYLNPSITVGKQVEEVLRVKKGMSRREARTRSIELLAAMHIRDPEYVHHQFPHELSGGMLQRALIAAAVASEPALLIADEATTALDVTVQAEIIDLLADLRERLGLALIVVSHDLAVVAQLCSKIIVMRAGEVVEQGTRDEVLFSPRHEYTRLLLDEHHRYGLERFLGREEASDD
ncbi:MAG: ABC transporter ATP-binding protein [Humibacter sp.]